MSKTIETLEKFLSLVNAGSTPNCPHLKELIEYLRLGDWDKIEKIIPQDIAALIQGTGGLGLIGDREPISLEELINSAKKEATLLEIISWGPKNDKVKENLMRHLKSDLGYVAGRCCDTEIWKRRLGKYIKRELDKRHRGAED